MHVCQRSQHSYKDDPVNDDAAAGTHDTHDTHQPLTNIINPLMKTKTLYSRLTSVVAKGRRHEGQGHAQG